MITAGKSLTVSKMVSKLGYVAITGRGYYLPNEPDTIHPLTNFTPPIVSAFLKKLIIDKFLIGFDYVYYRILPRISKKAVIHLGISEGGGQLLEWQSCVQNIIPILGFAVRDQISKSTLENCDHLAVEDQYVQCLAPDSTYCLHRRFCPFLDPPTSISTIIVDVLIGNRENLGHMLVGVEDVSNLTPALEKFLN